MGGLGLLRTRLREADGFMGLDSGTLKLDIPPCRRYSCSWKASHHEKTGIAPVFLRPGSARVAVHQAVEGIFFNDIRL